MLLSFHSDILTTGTSLYVVLIDFMFIFTYKYTASFRYSFAYGDGFNKTKNYYIKKHMAVFVIIMVLNG